MLQYRPNSPTQSSAIDTYFHFGRKAPARDRILGRDALSGISIDRPLKQLSQAKDNNGSNAANEPEK